MAKSNVEDFIRKERVRRYAAALKGTLKSKPVADLAGIMPARKPYKLSTNEAVLFGKLATQGCFKCKGTGVARWRHLGMLAEFCKCVQKKLDELKPNLEEQKAWVIEQLNAGS